MVGFRTGQTDQLSYAREVNEVRIALLHGSEGAVLLVLRVAEFERWFVK